ncbi:MAG: rhomboid family intramembrane serine protease [Pirellulales bacterium]
MLPRPVMNFQRTPVTLLITAIAVAIELVCVFDPERRHVYYNDFKLGILSPMWAGELWRPFTTTLLHANPLHAFFNVYWLATFGPAVEHRFGSYRTLGLIVLLAYVSMLPEFVISNYDEPINGQIGALGLSGIMYGLFGMIWVGRQYAPEFYLVCDQQVVLVMMGWLVFCIFATLMNLMPVANIAHVSGLLFGALYGMAVFDRKRRIYWITAALIGTLVVLTTMFYCPGHPGYEYHRQRRIWLGSALPPVQSYSATSDAGGSACLGKLSAKKSASPSVTAGESATAVSLSASATRPQSSEKASVAVRPCCSNRRA